MSYPPITIVAAGEISLTDVDRGILLRKWSVNMGGRPGAVSDYHVEILIAVRDHMVSCFDEQIMMADDMRFSPDLAGNALMAQMLHAPKTVPTPPKRHPWWRFWGA